MFRHVRTLYLIVLVIPRVALPAITPIDLPASVGASPDQVTSFDVSPDGNLVVFRSDNSLIPVPGVLGGQLFLLDRTADTLELVGRPEPGEQMRDAARPRISNDGQRVSFLATGTTPTFIDPLTTPLWVRDRQAPNAVLASLADGGALPGVSGTFFEGRLARDANLVAFTAPDGLVPGDQNGVNDVLVHDRVSLSTVVVSGQPGGGTLTQHGFFRDISDDGRFVLFNTRDLYFADRQTQTVTEVSNLGGTDAAFYGMSPDASFVAFGESGSSREGWVFERAAGVTTPMAEFFGITIRLEGINAVRFSPNNQYAAVIGNRIFPRDIVQNDIMLINRSDGQVARATQAPDGTPAGRGPGDFEVLDDGTVVFAHTATNLGGSLATIAYEFVPGSADLSVTIDAPTRLSIEDARDAMLTVDVTNQGGDVVRDAIAWVSFGPGMINDPTVSGSCRDDPSVSGMGVRQLACQLDVLNPGQTVSFDVSGARTSTNGVIDDTIVMNVLAQSAGSFDMTPTNNRATATISVSDNPPPPPPGPGGGGSGGGGGIPSILTVLGLMALRFARLRQRI